MTSDSELEPSPLPSPIFARCSPARGTVAKRCREFYIRRLERTASMQKRWSICEGSEVARELSIPNQEPLNCEERTEVKVSVASEDGGITLKDSEDAYPLRKCRSSLDLAMDSLRKEISSLIAQDNDLFRQLLSLHDSIAELRERQRHSVLCPDDEDEDEDDIEETGHDSHSLSLESLSDPGELPETSPESTLSSRSSLSGNSCDYKPHRHHHHHHHHRYIRQRTQDVKQRHRGKASTQSSDDSRPIIFIDKSEICFRCRKMAPPYRRSNSITSLYYLHEDLESFDSGIHLQGSHSDSDHEIFV